MRKEGLREFLIRIRPLVAEAIRNLSQAGVTGTDGVGYSSGTALSILCEVEVSLYDYEAGLPERVTGWASAPEENDVGTARIG